MALKNHQEESFFSGIKFRSSNEFLMEDWRAGNSNGFDNISCGEIVNSGDYNYGGESVKVSSVVDDIVDLLPSDPFGMEISATFTAITDWIEDFGLMNLGFDSSRSEGVEVENGDDQFLAELNIFFNSATRLHPDINTYKDSSVSSMKLGLCDDPKIEKFMGFSHDKYWTFWDAADKHTQVSPVKNVSDGVPGPPPDALSFVLGYLGLEDLLSVERVCKSLRNEVQNDPLLWRNFHVSDPLCYKITDDALLSLTNRAQGSLRSLSIEDCLNITDGGLKRVLEMNPGLTKLSVAGCIRLSIGGTLSNLRFFNSVGRSGIKHLRIGEPFGVTSQHFEELNLLLGAENKNRVSSRKQRFVRAWQLYLSFDDERPIDIEICPRCQQFRQVYDCPTDSCRGKCDAAQACRACIYCIARCRYCGRCLNNCEYEETFCLEPLCLDCVKLLFNRIKSQVTISSSMASAF